MKLTQTFLVVAMALASPMAAFGEDDQATENTVVVSQKSTAELRSELWKFEDEFYALYNKLNDDNLYDVRCTQEAPTGSRIKQQICRPVFLTRALSRGKIDRNTNLETNPAMASKFATYRQKMASLMAANQELQAAAARFSTARAEYMAQTERAR